MRPNTQIYFCVVLLIFVSSGKAKLDFGCNDLQKLIDESKNLVSLRRIYDNFLRKNHVTLSRSDIGYDYFRAKPLDFNISEQYSRAEILTQAASLFYDQIKADDIDSDIPKLFQNYSHCLLQQEALPILPTSQFRSIDGHGNNLKRSSMGASFTQFGRLLKAQYDDNIHAIRKSIRGYKLPSARNIVRKIFLNDKSHLSKFQTHQNIPNMLAVMFGKYIAYDVGSMQANQYVDGGDDGIRCCSNFNKIQLPSSLMNSACLPITVSRSDPIYSPQNIKCLGFLRSNMISNDPIEMKVGEKVNAVTSFLDHSAIYGSDRKSMLKVRSFNGGRLKVNHRNVLPLENKAYFSGDERVNLTPFYTIWSSIFVRNHNDLADKLAMINRHWEEERIFQEARKVNIAIYQKIIYEEWLPIFLGESFTNVSYDETVDASTSNEFSAGSFRFLHSFINSEFEMVDEGEGVRTFNTSDTILKPKMLESLYDSALRGLLKQRMNVHGYSTEILNKIFKGSNDFGLDLLSLDIVRGRDHGVPAYYKFRKMCNMKTNIKVFNDLAPEIPFAAITQLRQTYKSVYDIDLLVGGALEKLHVGNSTEGRSSGVFGETFACILSEQFRRFKAGDRFFYSHDGQFTFAQAKSIGGFTMSNLLCENSDLRQIQANAFLTETITNVRMDCQQQLALDLDPWREH